MWWLTVWWLHYNDVIMGAIAAQITSLTIVYSIVYSDADQRKHQSSASLAFVRRIHRGPVNSPHKWPVTRKMFPFDDVIVRSFVSWCIMVHHYRLVKQSINFELSPFFLNFDITFLPDAVTPSTWTFVNIHPLWGQLISEWWIPITALIFFVDDMNMLLNKQSSYGEVRRHDARMTSL